MKATIHVGDCLEVLKGFAPNSVDAIVCDPPYEIGFMGKAFDKSGIAHNVALWRECLRVLKPGGHMLAFGGSRTYHRLACAVEDAGFEIRDQIMWIYGSGFPKSLDVSKAIDKAAGAEREVIETRRVKSGGTEHINRENVKQDFRPGAYQKGENILDVTAPATEGAKQWQGWGTALKPAHEPIVVARKPLEGTVAANVQKWGTGALNIDGCRVEGVPEPTRFDPSKHNHEGYRMTATGAEVAANASPLGRWPANVIHDGSEEVTSLFPEQTSGAMTKQYEYKNTGFSLGAPSGSTRQIHDSNSGSAARFFYQVRGDEPSADRTYEDQGSTNFAMKPGARRLDEGSAARFYYTAKADRTERNAGVENPGPQFEHGATLRKIENTEKRGNTHPTVKPVDLMAYLCRLVTPPNGIVLDPFLGSGSTGIAAQREGFEFIGIEINPEYAAIAENRIRGDNPLFADVELKA